MPDLTDAIQFLFHVPDSSLLYVSSYHRGLVVASILIAILGSYAALSVASRIQQTEYKWVKATWVILGALAMGSGVWAMHFIGMLSLRLPCGIYYDPATTLISMVPSILASAVALSVVSHRGAGNLSLPIGSVLIGVGIGAMHYTGMAAMRLQGLVRYDPTLFALSIGVAVLLAYAALRVRKYLWNIGRGRDILGAILMGGAISGMHYTAMSAAYFIRGNSTSIPPSAFSPDYLAIIVIIVTGLLVLLVVVTAIAYRNLEMAQREERWRFALEGAGDGVWDWNIRTGEIHFSRCWKEMLGFAEDDTCTSLDEWHKHIHAEDRERVLAGLHTHLAGETSANVSEYRILCKGGNWKWILDRGMVISRDALGKPVRMVGTYSDITLRHHSELRIHSLNQVLTLLAERAPLNKILQTIANGVEQESPTMLCSILLMDAEGKSLLTGAASSLPDFYNEAIHGVEIGMGVGSCGTAAFTGRRTIVEDIQTHPYWVPYKELAAAAGLGSCWSEPIKNVSGKVLGTFAIYHHETSLPSEGDVQLIEQAANLAGIAIEQNRANEELQLASLIYQNSSEAMTVTDAAGIIITVNPAFTKLTGYSPEEVIGLDHEILSSGRHDQAFYEAMWHAINTTGQWQGEIWDKRKNGEVYAKWLTINTVFDADGAAHRRVALFSDITEKKKSDELIWQQANFDLLTGLPNRRMFHDRLEQEMKKASRTGLPMALMFLDLDRFKEINDTLGHHMGDCLLKDAAQRLAGCVRASDTVARLGGDEFIVILSELDDPTCVQRIAQDILRQLTQPFQLGDELAYVSASIGITLYPDDAVHIDALLKHADQAMYAAKSLGRNRYHYFTPAMQNAAQNLLHLTNDLRRASAEQQLQVHYQPIVELLSGAICKAEALLRWRHPTRGLISPAEFIPIAEYNGMIAEIGDWVFREAVQWAANWRKSHHAEFQISINKSPMQFRGPCGNDVSWPQQLQALGLPGQSIVVEITEGLLLEDSEATSDKLLAFRNAGIQISLDDFGTGYSSLSYLKHFDIDYLKIDQSFVRSLSPDSDDLVLCEAIIVMAHKLGMKVIAEGVETTTQRDLLVAAGCDFGQGYLFSRPLPAEEFDVLLKADRMRPELLS